MSESNPTAVIDISKQITAIFETLKGLPLEVQCEALTYCLGRLGFRNPKTTFVAAAEGLFLGLEASIAEAHKELAKFNETKPAGIG